MLRDVLIQKAGISSRRLFYIQENASKLYKVYTIPKRNGSERVICQPTPELKSIQRWLSRAVFGRLPVSDCATAYKKSASIKKNAELHRATSFTVHLDFENFFESFSRVNVIEFLREGTRLSDDDIRFCSDIVTRHGRLTIGAPSSPSVSNALMHSFDAEIKSWCLEKDLIYSRYADDINISAFEPNSLSQVHGFILEKSAEFKYADLRLNEEKTSFLSRKYRRAITGVTLTPDKKLSIGRGRKREIKALVHKYGSGVLDVEASWRLAGLVSFAYDVEPTFVESLKLKYGKELISQLIHLRVPRSFISES